MRGTNDIVSAYTGAGELRLQITLIRCETRKRIQQQAKGATQQLLLRGADMQSRPESAWAWPYNRSHELAGPGRRTSCQDNHTGRHRCSQKGQGALGTEKEAKIEAGFWIG